MNQEAPASLRTDVPISVWWAVVLIPLAVIAFGLVSSGVLTQPLWQGDALKRMVGLAAAYGTAAAVVLSVRPRIFGPLLATAALWMAITAGGIAPVASILIFLAAAQVVGDLILGDDLGDLGALLAAALRVVMGIAFYCCLTGLFVYFPVNYPSLYWLIAFGPLLLRWRRLLYWGSVWKAALEGSSATAGAIERAATVLFGFCLLVPFTVALMPEVSYDALSMHLYVPAYIEAYHRWTFPTEQVAWAAMPMTGDWGYSMLYLMGGELAARLLNFSALAVLAALLVTFLARFVSPGFSLLLASAFLSSPIAGLITGSMFIDNFLALWVFSLLVLATGEGLGMRSCYAAFFLIGVAIQTKFGSLPAAAVLVIPITGALRKTCRANGRGAFLHLPAAALVCVAVALVPYVTAWSKTGNPIYPVPVSLASAQPSPLGATPFHEPLRWTALYDLTFDSGNYLESQHGSFGFHYLLLIPLGAAAFALVKLRGPRIAFAAGLFSFVVVYLGSSYIRYLYPSLPLLVAASAGALAVLESRAVLLTRTTMAALCLLTVLNLAMLPAAGWYNRPFLLPSPGDPSARNEFIDLYRPVMKIIHYINLTGPGRPAAFLGTHQIAGLAAPAYTLTWHHGWFDRSVKGAATAMAVGSAMKKYGIEWFVTPEKPDQLTKPVQEFLQKYTEPAFTANHWQARRWNEEGKYPEELLKNGEFNDGYDGWSAAGAVRAEGGKVRVTEKDVVSQSFSAVEGDRFLYSLTASCPSEGTLLRMQINWVSAAGGMAGVSIEPTVCVAGEKKYTVFLTAPPATSAGTVIVSAHSGGEVLVERASLRR